MKKSLLYLAVLCSFPALVAVSQDQNKKKEAKAEQKSEAKPERTQPAPDPRKPREVMPRKRTATKSAPPEKPAHGSTKRAWIGIATGPVPGSLREYLEIDEGFGIQIVKTMEGSPAEKAGLRANDVVLKLDDQWLISPEHLSLLVRRMSKSDVVTLNLLRKGKEMNVKVTLGESEMAVHPGRHFHGHAPPQSRGNPRAWQEAMKQQQDYWNEWMQKQRPEIQNRTGRPPSVSMKPGFPVKVFGTEGVVKIDNEKGELTITNQDGDHQIVIKDTGGTIVHEGAFDPDKGTESLPEAAQKHLKEMKIDDLKVLTPGAPRPQPEKTAAPAESQEAETAAPGKSKELL